MDGAVTKAGKVGNMYPKVQTQPILVLCAETCKENGLSSEMVEKYCPDVFGKLFPV